MAYCRRYFHIHFLVWKSLCFNSNFSEVCHQGSNWQYDSIGSNNGLVLNKRQALSERVMDYSVHLYPTFSLKWVNVELTHWGRVTHICVNNLTIIGPDNGLSPGRRQAIIWTNTGMLLIGPLGTNFNEILLEIHTFSFKKIHFKMSSGKWRPFCPGLNVLTQRLWFIHEKNGCFPGQVSRCYFLRIHVFIGVITDLCNLSQIAQIKQAYLLKNATKLMRWDKNICSRTRVKAPLNLGTNVVIVWTLWMHLFQGWF